MHLNNAVYPDRVRIRKKNFADERTPKRMLPLISLSTNTNYPDLSVLLRVESIALSIATFLEKKHKLAITINFGQLAVCSLCLGRKGE